MPPVTKPGNPDDRPAEATETGETAETAETTEPRPAEPEAAGTTDAPESTDDAEPAKDAPVKDAPAAEPVAVPVTELEKAPPVREEPVMPTAKEAAAATVRRRGEVARPNVVRIAFYLAIASTLVGLFSALDLFLSKAELVDSALSIDTPNPLTPQEADRAVSSLLWLYLVVVAALGAFLVLFAYKAQDGVRRARMMSLIITLILLLFHFYFFGTVYGQVSGLFAAITIALLYVPSTREFFGPRQTVR